MRTIPLLFVKQTGQELISREINTDCDWVLDYTGKAYIKLDGIPCLIANGILYRSSLKKLSKSGKKKISRTLAPAFAANDFKKSPDGWIPAQPTADPYTGKWAGWVPVTKSGNDRYYREAFGKIKNTERLSGITAELLGPKILDNPHHLNGHVLYPHTAFEIHDLKRTFDGIREWLSTAPCEGIVFHHPDGRMAKIRRTDYGLDWPLDINRYDILLANLVNCGLATPGVPAKQTSSAVENKALAVTNPNPTGYGDIDPSMYYSEEWCGFGD